MDEIDKLLSEVKDEYSNSQQISKPIPQPNSSSNQSIASPRKSASAIDKLLDDVKSDFEKKDLAEELQRQQELEAERIRQEQLKAKRQEGLKQEAKNWLEKLDPFSPEGLWFERFAEGYPSKLEAAIEYLQSLES